MTKGVVITIGAITAAATLAAGYWAGRATAPDTEPDRPVQQTDAGQVGVSSCGTEPPQRRPDEIIGTCADGGTIASEIQWRTWSPTYAVGVATVNQNDCNPNCAEGQTIPYPATVLLDQVHENGSGEQFTRMVIAFTTDRGDEETSVQDYALPMYP